MIGRPERTEAAEFYWTYIDKVPGDDVVAVLEGQMEEALIFHASVTEERSLYRYAEGKWSIRESMNHVTDTERIFVCRALWFARGLEGALPSFDQDVAVEGAMADGTAWAAHVDEFMQVRMATVSFFKNLPEEAWMRRGTASGKACTVRAMAFMTAGHVAHHFGIFRERYLYGRLSVTGGHSFRGRSASERGMETQRVVYETAHSLREENFSLQGKRDLTTQSVGIKDRDRLSEYKRRGPHIRRLATTPRATSSCRGR